METKTSTTISLDALVHLPKFASYLLTEKLDEFVQKQLAYSVELDIPLLKFFLALPPDQRVEMSRQSSAQFLQFLADNKASEQIANSIKQWKTDQLPLINRDEVAAEDITLVNHMRKKSMLHFIPEYTNDAWEIIELVKEIDRFVIQSITVATNQYIDLFKERLEEHSHFIQKVAETIPGAVYVFDVDAYKGIYSNKKLADILGYSQAELNNLGESAIPFVIHPDDQHILKQESNAFKSTSHEPRVIKYRIRNKDGSYKWVANYESVFKRKEDGSVLQTIGITLDIDKEQKALEELHLREKLLREAQDIAQLGNYYWDFANEHSAASPKALELLEIEGKDFTNFWDNIHPDDKERVEAETKRALITGNYNCEYRINGKAGTKLIWARGAIEHKDGKAVGMTGTVMDVTGHNQLVQKLAEADQRHKQAEALTHIGTYSWDTVKDEIEWSDEMYRIYEAIPGQKINYQFVVERVHPEDRQIIDNTLKECLKNKTPYDFYYRITTSGGKEKIIHSRGAPESKPDGRAEKIVGTDQDVTEKQNLIRRLRKSESLYKQAEEIADMGNWTWDVKANKLEWTDQLYRIYGMEPQSEEVTIERFLSFVHPDDREYVQQGVEELNVQNSLDYTFRIVTEDGTQKWLRSIAQVVRGNDGEIISVIGTEQDVTEKQKLIGKLEESQRLYKQAQELAQMGNFSWNVRTNDVFWSDEVYKIYERPYGEKVNFEDAFSPIIEEHKKNVQQAIEETITQKEGRSISYAIRKQDGGLKYINLHTDVSLNKEGEVEAVIGTAQDVTQKEELIERLKESERLYMQAQSMAQMGNWTFDFTNNNITWSDELFDIYELPKGSPPTVDEWKKYLGEESEKTFAAFEDTLATNQPLDVTHTIHLPSGKSKVLHRKGEVIFNKEGKPIKLIGTTQDVTQQLRIQADLRESQNFIRKITDATPSIIASYNINTGVYTFISEGLTKLLGYTVEEVMEKGVAFFTEIMHPEDLEVVTEKNRKVLEEANKATDTNDIVAEFTYRIRHKNGSYRWFHTYGTVFDRNKQGNVEHLLNISLDVTEQKEAIETIREQEYFIQQIADASPTILYLFDIPTQSFAYINREAFFVLGYRPDEIAAQGNNITRLLYHPDEFELLPARAESKKTFQQVDSMIQYECRMKHKDGDYRWVLVREIVFKTNDKGEIAQIIGAALDITRRKEMEKTILQNAHQLEQSNASLEEFAYVASHDLKEPLRKISTFGDRLMASQADKLADDGKIYLQKIVEASQRMQNMISDLLSISMISGNRSFEPTSLQKILEETLQTLEYKIEQQKALIRYDVLPTANVVPSQFRQLFQNLISNSLKFLREDVQPVISIHCVEARPEEVNSYQLAKAGTYLKISFSDNGIGFENEYAQKIFAIFQRLHGRSEYEGSGIGLAICKKIVEHHGGAIFAQGQLNEGATFTIILPHETKA